MANTLLTADTISKAAIGLLARQLVLPMTATRVLSTDFGAGHGDTVTLRVPATVTARTQATPGAAITYDDITETSVPVTLSHLYLGVKITDEDLTLNITDFGQQILAPQVEAVARGAENQLATAMNDLAADDSIAVDGSDIDAKLRAARKALSQNDVPHENRFLAASPDVIDFILADDRHTLVNESGSPSALHEARVGKRYGFTIVESNALTAGTAVAYHRSSFGFGTVVPSRNIGAPMVSVQTYQSIAMRWVKQWDSDILSDASVVSVFAGAAAVDAGNRAYKLDTATA